MTILIFKYILTTSFNFLIINHKKTYLKKYTNFNN